MKRWYRVYRESYCEVFAHSKKDAKHEARRLLKECWKDIWTLYDVRLDRNLNEDEDLIERE